MEENISVASIDEKMIEKDLWCFGHIHKRWNKMRRWYEF